MSFFGKVINVLSGDTLVLVNPGHKGKTSPTERIVTLSHIQAPRNNEKYAFESKEFLRESVINQVVKCKVSNITASGREFGECESRVHGDLGQYIVANGGAKVRDRVDEMEASNLKDAEDLAKTRGLGLWDDKVKIVEVRNSLTEAELEKSKVKPYDAIVERVLSGDRLKITVLLKKYEHAELLVNIAGVRAPDVEPYSQQVKYYIELFYMAHKIKVNFLGELSNGIPIAQISNDSDVASNTGTNLSQRLLKEGLAEVDDRQSIILGASNMSVLRNILQEAKSSKKGKWSAVPAPLSSTHSAAISSSSVVKVGAKFSAVVSKVISAETLNVYLDNDEEITVQLASLRSPRQNDPATVAFISDAREFVRKKIIGKKISLNIVAIRPKSENFEERPLVTVSLSNGKNLSESIVESGYASVINHRAGDVDRAPNWDLLVELQETAKKNKKGIYGKAPEKGKVIEASEEKTRAAAFLNTFKSRNSIPAIVEKVIKYNRFVIFLPRESIRMVLVLGGLANVSNNDLDLSKQALNYVVKKYLQRDVNISVYKTDNTGAFVGNLFSQNQSLPLQHSLLLQGLAKIHEPSINQTGFASELTQAQEEAQTNKVGLWVHYDSTAENSVDKINSRVQKLELEPKFLNVDVKDISKTGTIFFHLKNEENENFKKIQDAMRSYLASKMAISRSPKRNEVIAIKDPESEKFYRAKVLSHSKFEYEVQRIDYGLIQKVSSKDIYELPSNYSTSSCPTQLHSADLSLLKVPPPPYLDDFIDTVFELTETDSLVAVKYNDSSKPDVDCNVVLYDYPVVSAPGKNNVSINRQLVEKGLAIVKKDLNDYEKLLKAEWEELIKLENEAKRKHIGCWMYGDVEEDSDLY
ncbi:hypothetical protein PACTADRAFT_1532 [Pachysolen tannophilus NRRL Y-2460]|uniref:Uncharacterized protein n=1 Tax=Pachysolen tannophilus NRRL Y-2460 TaxID=669874 RepID=A0A1E4TYY0_PACTA|nr:hypothetical protein PACTADRAFT_1532 [Pachysolen tannophilus NRRL Y-2460]